MSNITVRASKALVFETKSARTNNPQTERKKNYKTRETLKITELCMGGLGVGSSIAWKRGPSASEPINTLNPKP